MNAIQLGLPLPRPERAQPWPNDQGFDIEIDGHHVEIMDTLNNSASARFETSGALFFGTGANWFEAITKIEIAGSAS